MITPPPASDRTNRAATRWLTFMMFMMFAMTTDSVGVIIPQIIKDFGLTMTAAGAFHYTTMIAIAVAGVAFGHLADTMGRKRTIVLGLALFAVASSLFAAASAYAQFLVLLTLSGMAIGIFKTGALALIGDISASTNEHTSTMNAVEGFFGVGAIIGPAIVIYLMGQGLSWKWLYAIAAAVCVLLIAVAAFVEYPHSSGAAEAEVPLDLKATARMMRDPFALAFSAGAFLYVAVESAIYVWMPTLLSDYTGRAWYVATYAISIFFVLRAGGRFLGAWMLARYNWTTVTALVSFAILACFAASIAGGVAAAVWLLPLSGLFMSVVYPTLNSKGISCFPKARHGAVAGVILFFTCAGAAVGPLAMGAVSDLFGHARYGFMLATAFAVFLHVGLLLNWIYDPAARRLRSLDESEYALRGEGAIG